MSYRIWATFWLDHTHLFYSAVVLHYYDLSFDYSWIHFRCNSLPLTCCLGMLPRLFWSLKGKKANFGHWSSVVPFIFVWRAWYNLNMVYLPPPFINTWGERANPKTCQRSNKSAAGGSGGDEFCSNWHYKTYILELHLNFWESQVNLGSSWRRIMKKLLCTGFGAIGTMSFCWGTWAGAWGFGSGLWGWITSFFLYSCTDEERSLRATEKVPMPGSKVYGNTLLVCFRSGVEVEDF